MRIPLKNAMNLEHKNHLSSQKNPPKAILNSYNLQTNLEKQKLVNNGGSG